MMKLQSLAVDFPKTAVPPRVPREAKAMLRQHGYPDFMEKADSYRSDKLLGRLYRRCRTIAATLSGGEATSSPGDAAAFSGALRPDRVRAWCLSHLDEPSLQAMLRDAQRLYNSYGVAVSQLAARFDLRSDVELAFGEPLASAAGLGDRYAVGEAMKRAWASLQDAYRDCFSTSVHARNKDNRVAWVAAWYLTAYTDEGIKVEQGQAEMKPLPRVRDMGGGGEDEDEEEGGEGSTAHPPSGPFLSFPWVVPSAMCGLLSALLPPAIADGPPSLQLQLELQPSESVAQAVGHSALSSWLSRIPELRTSLSSLQETALHIRLHLQQGLAPPKLGGPVRVQPYGSAALLLCDGDSDLDLCVLPTSLSVGVCLDQLPSGLDPAKQVSQWSSHTYRHPRYQMSTNVIIWTNMIQPGQRPSPRSTMALRFPFPKGAHPHRYVSHPFRGAVAGGAVDGEGAGAGGWGGGTGGAQCVGRRRADCARDPGPRQWAPERRPLPLPQRPAQGEQSIDTWPVLLLIHNKYAYIHIHKYIYILI
jgi:hypothetical protein